MKKALLGAAMMISFLSFSFAQTTTQKAEKHAKHKTSAVKSAAAQTKADIKTSVKDIKSAAKQPAAKPEATANRLKKDGTPDKRYKANKKA